MGRQTYFFVSPTDASALLKFLTSKGVRFLDYLGSEIIPNEHENIVCYIALPNAQINFCDNQTLDFSNSEVIELSLFPQGDSANHFEEGRIWYNKYALDRDACEFYIKPHETELSRLFNSIHRYIRNHYRISINRLSYIAPDAYQEYLNGTFIPCNCGVRIAFEKSNDNG